MSTSATAHLPFPNAGAPPQIRGDSVLTRGFPTPVHQYVVIEHRYSTTCPYTSARVHGVHTPQLNARSPTCDFPIHDLSWAQAATRAKTKGMPSTPSPFLGQPDHNNTLYIYDVPAPSSPYRPLYLIITWHIYGVPPPCASFVGNRCFKTAGWLHVPLVPLADISGLKNITDPAGPVVTTFTSNTPIGARL